MACSSIEKYICVYEGSSILKMQVSTHLTFMTVYASTHYASALKPERRLFQVAAIERELSPLMQTNTLQAFLFKK
jgi:hypothetical protein